MTTLRHLGRHLGRHLERPGAAPGRGVVADWGGVYAANGLIGFIFAATGPLAIILAAGGRGGLSPGQLASWVFGAFFVNGALTVGMSWRYRLPLCFFWTIPGTVLVGQALTHLPLAEVLGAFYVTAGLLVVVGVSGWIGRAMRLVPMPIVMGMVAGVFLRFGLDLVRAVRGDFGVAGPMVGAFLVLSAVPRLGRAVPPLIGALVVGAAAVWVGGRMGVGAMGVFGVVHPVVTAPAFSGPALAELVVPLLVTVLVVQNGQGFAVLGAAGHRAPVNTCTAACGVASVLAAAVGAVNSCVTGPTNALVVSSGVPGRQYTAAMTTGGLAMVFGLFAPAFTGLLLAAPAAFVTGLGGLAMLRVLQGSFVAAFGGAGGGAGGGRCTMGALVSFLVTVADVPVFNIGGAFWGLVAGVGMSVLVERGELRG